MENLKSVKISRQVFDKDKFNETVDTSFSQLIPLPDPSFFDRELATLEDFWYLYNKFFLLIPKEGEVNSHTYLIEESTEYINYAPNQAEIQALLDEIAELREENLGIYQDLANQATEFAKIKEIQDSPQAVLQDSPA